MKKATQFQYPLESGGRYITLGFLDSTDGGKTLHPGVDFNLEVDGQRGNADLGKPVYCVAHGLIAYSKDGTTGFGRHIWVKHSLPDGSVCYSHYAHLDNRYIAEGQEIDRGAQIGTLGKSGVEYAHLHLEITSERLYQELGPTAWPSSWSAEKVKNYYYDPIMFLESHREEWVDWQVKYEEEKMESEKKGEKIASLEQTITSYRDNLDDVGKLVGWQIGEDFANLVGRVKEIADKAEKVDKLREEISKTTGELEACQQALENAKSGDITQDWSRWRWLYEGLVNFLKGGGKK